MRHFNEQEIRTSFVNASLRERNEVLLPQDLHEMNRDSLDYLGWRDRRVPAIGYIVVELDFQPVGILVRQAEGTPRSRAQCSWCEDVQLPNDVALFSAKRAGKTGRNGDTVGTLVCSNFECSANVRRRPALAYIGFDVEAERQRRIAALREHAANFVRDIRDSR